MIECLLENVFEKVDRKNYLLSRMKIWLSYWRS